MWCRRKDKKHKQLILKGNIIMNIDDIEEKSIVEALRANPQLKSCILEMIDITGGEGFKKLNLGDDAEEAVVSVIHKTGRTLLQDWAEKKAKDIEEEESKNKAVRAHKKKG